MVLSIPETGLQLESSAKSSDSLPLQAFAITLSDSVIEDLVQCAQNGEDVKLSLGNTPSFLYGKDIHKISKASEINDLDLYLTNPSESTQHAERLPHPSMSLFIKPPLKRYPKLAAGREILREKLASKAAASRKQHEDLPDDVARLKEAMEQAKGEKLEKGARIVNTPLGTAGKRGAIKGGKTTNKLLSSKSATLTGTISSRSSPASPALSGIVSPSLAPTLSGNEQAKELRAPLVHELALGEMSYEELRSKWTGDEKDFKPALDKMADFDSKLQKYVMKKKSWKELDVYNYDYESEEDRQTAIDNAIRMYDRMRLATSDAVWDKLLPKEERGKGKCLSKLQPHIANLPQPTVKTPQIKVHDAEDSSGSRNGDGSQSGAEKKKKAVMKKAAEPMVRSVSQTKQPVRKIEKKWVSKKTAAPKVSPTKTVAKPTKEKPGRGALSKEFISDSDSSSEEAPLSTTVMRSKAIEKEREVEKEKERERQRELEREQKDREQKEREQREQREQREREEKREREQKDKERERERQKERERQQREKEREQREREREKDKDSYAPATKSKIKATTTKEAIKSQVIARPAVQKRSRDEIDDDSSSSSGTPLSKRANHREIKAGASHSNMSYKRPPSDSSSQSSSRSNSYVGQGYSNKHKNTSPVKSSPLASSPPTNASDFDQRDEARHERDRDHERTRDRSVTVANGNINVKKRKADTDRDVIDVAVASKKRQRLSVDLLNKARKFKKHYEIYSQLHHELQLDGNFSMEKYDTLMEQRERLEALKASIYSQMPAECH